MTALQSFDFQGAAVRTIAAGDGDILFVGKDVCEVLGYADPTNAMKQHCKGVVKRHPLQTVGGMQEVRVISEPDVLRLIVRSRLAAAESFERWVFEDVLPSIRKTGAYGTPQADPMVALNDPVTMRTLLLGYTEKVLALESQVGELAPKAAALERIAEGDGLMPPMNAAKSLQIPPKRLFDFLRSNGWTYRRAGARSDVAYQDKIAAGYLTHKVHIARREDGSEKVCEQVMVTPKGLAKLAQALQTH